MRTLLMDSLRLLFFISMENVMLRMWTLVWESQLLILAIEFFAYLYPPLEKKTRDIFAFLHVELFMSTMKCDKILGGDDISISAV